MTTDKELLELAAKAAGIEIEPCTRSNKRWPFKIKNDFRTIHWNPLASDGDALRLAVKLASESKGASFTLSISKMHDGRGFADAGFFSHTNPTEQAINADIAAATRRAIVCAAAEIGKAMP